MSARQRWNGLQKSGSDKKRESRGTRKPGPRPPTKPSINSRVLHSGIPININSNFNSQYSGFRVDKLMPSDALLRPVSEQGEGH